MPIKVSKYTTYIQSNLESIYCKNIKMFTFPNAQLNGQKNPFPKIQFTLSSTFSK